MSPTLPKQLSKMVTWCAYCSCKQYSSLNEQSLFQTMYKISGRCTVCAGKVNRLIYRPAPVELIEAEEVYVSIAPLLSLLLISTVMLFLNTHGLL